MDRVTGNRNWRIRSKVAFVVQSIYAAPIESLNNTLELPTLLSNERDTNEEADYSRIPGIESILRTLDRIEFLSQEVELLARVFNFEQRGPSFAIWQAGGGRL